MIDARLVLLAQANDEAHARTSCALQLLAPCDEPTLETAAFITVLIHLEMVGQEISVILLDRNDTKRRRLAGDLKNLVRSLQVLMRELGIRFYLHHHRTKKALEAL